MAERPPAKTVKPETLPTAPGPIRFVSAAEIESDPDLPPVPKPESPLHFPPETSTVIRRSTNVAPRILVEARGNVYKAMITQLVKCKVPDGYYKNENDFFRASRQAPPHGWLDPLTLHQLIPAFPDARLVFKRYWKRVGATSYRLAGPQQFTHSFSYIQGASKTETQTLSRELGVSLGKLSLKLSASFSKSHTVYDETQRQQSYSVTAREGEIVVYTLWQLVEEFDLADATDRPLEWSGHVFARRIDRAALCGSRFIYGQNRTSYFKPQSASFPPGRLTNRTPVFYSDPVAFPNNATAAPAGGPGTARARDAYVGAPQIDWEGVVGSDGVWTGSWGPMLLRIDRGGNVRGVYAHAGGTIAGRLNKDTLTLTGRWCQSNPAASGELVFRFRSSNGARTILGRWRRTGDKRWRAWNLRWQKRQSDPTTKRLSARLAAAPSCP